MKAGISAMICAGAWLSNRFDLEVMSCGRSADDPPESFRLEMTGRFLAYDVSLNEGCVSVSAQPMDNGDPPEILLKVGDTLPEFRTVCELITALERNQIKGTVSQTTGNWRKWAKWICDWRLTDLSVTTDVYGRLGG